MRMLMNVSMPNEKFNAAVRDGSIEEKLNRVLEETHPELVYFTEYDGRRCAVLVVEVERPERIPALAEPWFLTFDAEVRFQIAMRREELAKADFRDIAARNRG